MRLELLQWFALLAAPAAWTVQLVFGYGVMQAKCGAAGTQWDLDRNVIEAALTAGALAIAVAAEVAAVVTYRQLHSVHRDAPGPRGRQHFLAVAALVGNVLFFTGIALNGVGVLAHAACRQS